jgi:hypothetical protein
VNLALRGCAILYHLLDQLQQAGVLPGVDLVEILLKQLLTSAANYLCCNVVGDDAGAVALVDNNTYWSFGKYLVV